MVKRLSLVVLLSMLSAASIAATPPQGSAYANLSALLAEHPLHGVLAHYDREMVALKQTLTPDLSTSIVQRIDRGTAVTRKDAGSARAQVRLAASETGSSDRADENAALSVVLAARHSSAESMSLYARRLQRESAAASAAYARASRTRVERASAAREQQLREKELDVAYDLARKNAPERLTLRIHLNELHLDRPTRARLEAELAGLSRAELATLSRMQDADAVTSSQYRNGLERQAAADRARMNEQLRAKAAANLALRGRVSQAASRSSTADLSTRIAAFRSAYPAGDNAAAIASAFTDSQTDIANRFARIGDSARRSRADAATQIANIARERAALRQAMVSQIEEIVRRFAEQRHLAVGDLTAAQPRGSVDLTAAIRAELAR
jgi:hypothetical protein